MKSLSLWLLVLTHLSCFVQSARAQSSATVEIATYAGLTVTGNAGWYYNIEATDDLTDSESWSVVETIQLDAGPVILWFDGSAPVSGKRFYRVANPPVLPVPNMVLIQAGSFVMGSPDTELYRSSNEGPQTTVTFTRDFYMGKYEVTQEEYLALIGSNPSFLRSDPSLPVDSVNWTTAAAYCDALTSAQRVAGRCPSDWSYRLPTEAEWEYVCRAGTSTPVPDSYLEAYEWFQDNSGLTTHPVGTKLPNPWGIYDMLGNVSEWCLDWSGAYPGGSVTDWVQPVTSFTRIVRGGNYLTSKNYNRSAERTPLPPDGSFTPNFGFRVVLAPIQ